MIAREPALSAAQLKIQPAGVLDHRHSRAGANPVLRRAKKQNWTPAFAGVTYCSEFR
jgi:hypothetical protein